MSHEHELENGVPKGSVLSVTLFRVAMQPIFRVLPKGVDVLLYAADILLIVRGTKKLKLNRKLQATCNWAKSTPYLR